MKQPVASWAVLTLIGRRRTVSSFLQGSHHHNNNCRRNHHRCGVRPFHQTTHLHHSSHHQTSKNIIGQSERTIIMEDNTRYCITTKNCTNIDGNKQQRNQKWIRIAFDPQFDTTITHHNRALVNERIAQQQQQAKQSAASTPSQQSDASTEEATNVAEDREVPASVLQYQRQLRKIQAADRASKTNVNTSNHLHTVYSDEHVVVTNKPSGILCVPGVNKNKSLLDLVFDVYGASEDELAAIAAEESERRDNNSNLLKKTKASKKRKNNSTNSDTITTSVPDLSPVTRDNMIVHRLDMDTSGIVIFARNRHAMSKLHEAFRQKDTGSTRKVYEALLVGWLDIDCWIDAAAAASLVGEEEDEIEGFVDDNEGDGSGEYLGGGEINLPLQRDHKHPPFMRVSTPHSEAEAHQAVADLNHAGYKKLIAKRPKPSVTQFRVVKHELWMGHKVTRVELYPVTGRTHQLRVHCAALGHPILGDPAYGYYGEANPNGGFSNNIIRSISPTYATMDLRDNVEKSVKESGRTMCLHAKELSLNHPVTGEWVSFSAAPSF